MRIRFGLIPLLALAGVVLAAPVTSHGATAWPDESTRPAQPHGQGIATTPAEERLQGDAWFYGRGRARDEAQAAQWYEKAAQGGDAQAENQIGYCYQLGIGVPVDLARALHWYQLAAASGLPAAKVNLGVAFLRGFGVRADPAFAAQLFREAAAGRDGRGASYLGDLYFLGNGVPQSMAEAERWYQTSAKLHDPVGFFDLGLLYSGSGSHARNLPKAEAWLRQSSAQGYVLAMHSLGLLLVNHPDLPQAPGEAVALLQEASRDGQWRASAVLAALERDGRLTGRDPASAYYHFLVASLQGGPAAQKLVANDLGVLASQLGSAQAATTQNEAKLWFTQHPRALDFVYKPADRDSAALAHLSPTPDSPAGAFTALPPS